MQKWIEKLQEHRTIHLSPTPRAGREGAFELQAEAPCAFWSTMISFSRGYLRSVWYIQKEKTIQSPSAPALLYLTQFLLLLYNLTLRLLTTLNPERPENVLESEVGELLSAQG